MQERRSASDKQPNQKAIAAAGKLSAIWKKKNHTVGAYHALSMMKLIKANGTAAIAGRPQVDKIYCEGRISNTRRIYNGQKIRLVAKFGRAVPHATPTIPIC